MYIRSDLVRVSLLVVEVMVDGGKKLSPAGVWDFLLGCAPPGYSHFWMGLARGHVCHGQGEGNAWLRADADCSKRHVRLEISLHV